MGTDIVVIPTEKKALQDGAQINFDFVTAALPEGKIRHISVRADGSWLESNSYIHLALEFGVKKGSAVVIIAPGQPKTYGVANNDTPTDNNNHEDANIQGYESIASHPLSIKSDGDIYLVARVTWSGVGGGAGAVGFIFTVLVER